MFGLSPSRGFAAATGQLLHSLISHGQSLLALYNRVLSMCEPVSGIRSATRQGCSADQPGSGEYEMLHAGGGGGGGGGIAMAGSTWRARSWSAEKCDWAFAEMAAMLVGVCTTTQPVDSMEATMKTENTISSLVHPAMSDRYFVREQAARSYGMSDTRNVQQ